MTNRIILPIAAVAALSLAACNTVNGAGKDLKSAGSTVSDVSGKGKK